MIIPDIEDSAESHYDPASHFKNLTKHGVFGAGTHAQLTGYLASYQLRDYGPWYRSKETLAGKNPYSGYLTNKKWHLNEVNNNKIFVHGFILILIMTFQGMANHLLRFQQVIHLVKKFWPLFVVPIQAGLTSLEVDFDEWEWEEELNVLTLEDVGLGKIFVEFSKRV